MSNESERRRSPPSGFDWRPYCNGPALYLGTRPVAMLVSIPNDRWRIDINPELTQRRHMFFNQQATAVAYVNAWANKWQDELRHRYGRLRSPHPH